jgi:iron complex outermembrane receptor protein
MIRKILILIISITFAQPSLAKSPDDNIPIEELSDKQSDEQSEMLELMNILEEETSIATKTKMNSDYVPGMVTILNGEDMQALGKLNVWEALSLVPGVKIRKSESDTPQVVVRGTPVPFNSGGIKIMLNSTTMSSEDSGLNSSILMIPIEQVERIEFIRGPSSSLYGNAAFLGLVNIITRMDNKQLTLNAQGGKDKDGAITNGSGAYFWQDPEKDLKVSVNLAIKNDKDANTLVNADLKDKQTSFIASVDYKKTSLIGQWFERKKNIDSETQTNFKVDEQALSLTLRHKTDLSESISNKTEFSYRENDFEENKFYKGYVSRAQTDFNLALMDKHQILLSMAFEHNVIDNATLCLAGHNPPLGCTPGVSNDLILSDSWNNYNISLEDQYAITKDLTLTAGVGLNNNGNIDESNITPRLAFVWQMQERHLLKGQYSTGFRSPTYFEIYDTQGNTRVDDSNQIDSYELGYIYTNNNLIGRVTVFHSIIDRLIKPGFIPNNISYDSNKAKTSGIELEWEQKINNFFKWRFNVSYNDTKDDLHTTNNGISTGASDWLGNLVLYIQPKHNILITSHYSYVSKQGVLGGNTIDGYDQLDLTINFIKLINNVSFRIGIKNTLDDEINYPNTLPVGVEAYEYQGRTWWAQMSYQF